MTELFVWLYTAVLDRAIHCKLSQVAFELQESLLSASRPQVKQTIQDFSSLGAVLRACSDPALLLLIGRFCYIQLALH